MILCGKYLTGKCYFVVLFIIITNVFVFKTNAQNSLNTTDIEVVEKLLVQYPDSAYNLLKKRHQLAKASQNKLLEAFCLEYMGRVLFQTGNYLPAIENLQAAEHIFSEQKKNAALAKTLNFLGTVYFYNGQAPFAFARYKEALTLYSQLKDHNGLTETYGLIGFFYEKQRKSDSAFHYQHVALKEPVKPKDSLVKAKIYENLGSLMEDRESYDSARVYFENALRLNQAFNNRAAQVEILNNLGDIFRKTGDLTTALEFSRMAMKTAEQLNDKYQLQSACADIGKTFKMMNRYDSALFYIEESKKLQHKIYTSDNSKQIALMRTLFEVERNNAEIIELNAARRVQSVIAIAAVAVCVLLAVLAWLILSRQSLKIKNERTVTDAQRKMLEAKQDVMEAELKNKELEEINLRSQLELKSKGLSSHILHLIQKNEVLETLRTDLTELIKEDKRDQKKQLKAIVQKINVSFNQDSYWEEFRLIFDQVHQPFFANIQKITPDLSVSELRLLSLIKMNLGSQEIATLLGITPDSVRVTKYRIKKKLNLGQADSLTAFIQAL